MKILVLDGGGQLGVFEWGVMVEFAKNGMGFDFFDCYFATSAGAFNAAFFAAGQIEQGTRMWLERLPNGFWKFLKNDMNFLENALRIVENLDCGKIASRKQKIYVTLSNAQTLKADYKCLNDSEDIIKTLLACCAMPLLSGHRFLDGVKYYDGGLTAQAPIAKALELESSEIWVISTKPKGYRVGKLPWDLLSLLEIFNPPARKLFKNHPKLQNEIMEMLDSDSNFKIIRPEKNLPIHFRSTNKKLIAQTFQLGKLAAKSFLANL